MKKLLPLLLLAVLLIGCEDGEPETPNDAVWDGNDIIRIGPYSELVRNLNLLYDPNFYSIDIEVVIGDETYTASLEDFFE